MGDLRGTSSVGEVAVGDTASLELGGSPLSSSSSSVTTSPLEVISLLRVIRLCGKRPREVCTCCLTTLFLDRKAALASGSAAFEATGSEGTGIRTR